MYKIYRIVYDGCVVYVGRTKLSFEKRRWAGYHGRIPKDILYNSIYELIEETTDIGREKYWVEFYLKQGAKLLNRKGGDSGLTKEQYRIENIDRDKTRNKKYYYANHKKELERARLKRERNKALN